MGLFSVAGLNRQKTGYYNFLLAALIREPYSQITIFNLALKWLNTMWLGQVFSPSCLIYFIYSKRLVYTAHAVRYLLQNCLFLSIETLLVWLYIKSRAHRNPCQLIYSPSMPTEKKTARLNIEASLWFFSCANFGMSAASAWTNSIWKKK